MILIDIGNTNLVIAASSGKVINNINRLDSNQKNNDLKKSFIRTMDSIIKDKRIDNNQLAIISSVVPKLTSLIVKILISNNIQIYEVKAKKILSFLKIEYNLNDIGADRIANSIAVVKKKIKNSVVIDLGTATTFEVLKNGVFIGGLIFPGINLSKKSLIDNTSLLKNTKVAKTSKIIAKNTKESIQSGFYWGYLLAINGIIKKISKEQKFKPKSFSQGV